MEQITAKDLQEDFKKETSYDHPILSGHYSHEYSKWLENKLASLRSVSETKEPDGYIINGKIRYTNEIHPHDLFSIKLNGKAFYFSPVPVSEVGQMDKVEGRLEQALLYLRGDVSQENIAEATIHIQQAISLLPVPNTKTQADGRGEEKEDVLRFTAQLQGQNIEGVAVQCNDKRWKKVFLFNANGGWGFKVTETDFGILQVPNFGYSHYWKGPDLHLQNIKYWPDVTSSPLKPISESKGETVEEHLAVKKLKDLLNSYEQNKHKMTDSDYRQRVSITTHCLTLVESSLRSSEPETNKNK